MTKCTTETVEFPGLKSRRIEAEFSGGDVSSDGGSLLLRQVDKKLKLVRELAAAIGDQRISGKVFHDLASILRQRVYGIALGYEELNDHETLRKDVRFQAALNRETVLAGSSTLCRFENGMNRKTAVAIHRAGYD